MSKKRFTFKSFEFAFNGIISLIKSEPNSRIHLLAAILAIILGLVVKIKPSEWIFLTMAIAIVFLAELINSSIERIADLVDPGYNKKIKVIKDLSAAGVLVSATASLVTGGIIFVPELIKLVK